VRGAALDAGTDVTSAAAAAAAAASDIDDHTPGAAEVHGVKARLCELRTREGELDGELSEALAVVPGCRGVGASEARRGSRRGGVGRE
jgi:hypothetical protein